MEKQFTMRYKFICTLLLCIGVYSLNKAQTPISEGVDHQLIIQKMDPGLQAVYNCNEAPILIIPRDYHGCPGESTEPVFIGQAVAHPGSPACPQPTLSYRDSVLYQGACGDLHLLRFWTAKDPVNIHLITRDTQEVLLVDTIAPVFQYCPEDLTVVAPIHECDVSAVWKAPIVSDNCFQLLLETNHYPGDIFHVGKTRVRYIAQDQCGNLDSCSFTVTVLANCCQEPPIIYCPADYNGCPGDSTSPKKTKFATGIPGGSDCNAPVISYNDHTISTLPCSYRIERTWYATDPLNSSLRDSCTQVITLLDTTPPSFNGCPADITVASNADCEAIVRWAPPQASDDCGIKSVVHTHSPGDTFPIGTTQVIYTAEDNCGHTAQCAFNITVTKQCCTEPPILQLPPDYSGCPGSKITPDISGRAKGTPGSKFCAQPTLSYKDTVLSIGPCIGQLRILRRWTAQDPDHADLKASGTQVITLLDTTPPSFNGCPADITVASNADCEAIVRWAPPQASDDCGIKSVIHTHTPGDTFPIGTTQVIYTAEDNCGQTAQCAFNITVTKQCCTEPPRLQLPPDYSGCPGSKITPDISGRAKGTPGSKFCAQPTLSYKDTVLSIGPCIGQLRILRRWTAQDPDHADLKTSGTQVITLQDTTSPSFNGCPADITVASNSDCEAIVQWSPPQASDDCGIKSVTHTHTPGDTFPIGTTQVVYTAEDHCGHTAQCAFAVTVIDNCCVDPPRLTIPTDYVGCPGTPLTTDITGKATAVAGGAHCGTPKITYKDTVLQLGPCSGQIQILRTWKAEDPDKPDLSSTGNQRLTLMDDTPPLFKNCPGDITINPTSHCEATADWQPPTAEDNCSNKVTIESNHQPGESFPAGVTTVIYTAKDGCGNEAKCSFDIVVEDNGITILCPGDQVLAAPYSEGGMEVEFPEPEATLCNSCLSDTVRNRFMYMGTFRGHKYFCSRFQMRWPDAKAKAESIGGYLAVIEDEEENAYIAHQLMGTPAYIGLTDEASEGHFKWVNGATLSYTNWAPGEPDDLNSAQDYVELYPDGQWKDQYMMRPREFVVEVPCYDIELLSTFNQGDFLLCGDYEVSYAVHNVNGGSDTCAYNLHIDCPMWMDYCPSRGLSTKNTWIEAVELGNQMIKSGNNGGYWAEKNKTIELNTQETQTMEVIPGGTATKVYWRAWIDYNRDGEFDHRESIGYGSYHSGMSIDFSIPSGTPLGLAAMRVILAYGKSPTDPCKEIGFGEVEDYYLYITSSPSKQGLREDRHEKSDHNSCTISPNPAWGQCIIAMPEGINEIKVYDYRGQLVTANHPGDATQTQIDVSEWPEGIYTLVIVDSTQQRVVKKLAVVR